MMCVLFVGSLEKIAKIQGFSFFLEHSKDSTSWNWLENIECFLLF